VPLDRRVGSGFSNDSQQSFAHLGNLKRHWRNSAAADWIACSAVFELSQRPGRIAPGSWTSLVR
jgi:hypothetical protein